MATEYSPARKVLLVVAIYFACLLGGVTLTALTGRPMIPAAGTVLARG